MVALKIESRSNPLIKHLRKLGVSRSYRKETREFLCDGPKLLEEAYKSGADIKEVLVDEAFWGELQIRLPWVKETKVTLCSQSLIDAASAVESPQGVLFSCAMPEYKIENADKIILLDHLQDTGNMGTIIRTADAFGINAVIAEESADFWNPKTVRATMGALFRIPLFSAPILVAIDECRRAKIPVYAAVLDSRAKQPGQIDVSRCAIVIGNEGNGVRREVADHADGTIYIPMPGKAESLNAAVAASILMWEMTRQN